MSFLQRLGNLWTAVTVSGPKAPSRISIPRDHVDEVAKLGPAFKGDEHYFQVRVNEMRLTHARQWWTQFDPMVCVVSEFIYDKQTAEVPFVVGPDLLEKKGVKTPVGMIYSDTRVAGIHPYRGGRLSLSVILCCVARDNHVRKLLQIVERTAGVLDFGTALSSYLKIAGVLVDGVEALLGMGQTQPLIGWRFEVDPDAGDTLEPGFYALIDKPDGSVNSDQLWVRKNRLLQGGSLNTATPYADAEYVLYSIAQSDTRGDVATLPFYPHWEHVLSEAGKPRKEYWESAKANMVSLYQTLSLSPDLTRKHAEQLADFYDAEMTKKHEKVVGKSKLSARTSRTTRFDKVRERSLEILQK